MYYTGDFGRSLITELDERRTGSDTAYGKMLKDVMEVELPKEEEPEEEEISRRRPRNGASLGLTGGGGRSRRGNNNSNNEPDPKETMVLNEAMGDGTAQKPDDEEFIGTIRPGVMLIGVGSKKGLIERAKAANLDALITFNVKVTTSRRGNPPTSTTSIKILDLKGDNEQMFSSRSLKDTMVQEKVDDGDDPVGNEIERLFSVLDEQFTAESLPSAINEDNVKKRIGRLLKTSGENPLPAAVEIVAFYEKRLLSEDLAKTAMSRLFKSDDAHSLIVGDSDQRLAFLSKWLPEGIVK